MGGKEKERRKEITGEAWKQRRMNLGKKTIRAGMLRIRMGKTEDSR